MEGVADYAIVMLDSAGKVISWNSGAQRIHGYGHEEIIGGNFACFFPRDDVAALKPQRQLQIAAAQGRHEDEGWRVHKNGNPFWASVITTALRDETGRLRGFAQVARDITETRRLEREVLDISEQEQRRLGHDLHDGLGQELTGLAFLSQNLGRRLAAMSLPEAAQAQRIETLTNKAIEQTRELARGLSPVELGPDALVLALGQLAATVKGVFHIPCVLAVSGEIFIPSDAAALHLFRIAQEAVNNAVRHAKATLIRIAIANERDDTLLSVEDNGIGLPGAGARGKGMGLRLMLYRARTIGAALELRPASPKGTLVVYRLPGLEALEPLATEDEHHDHDHQADSPARQEPFAHPAG